MIADIFLIILLGFGNKRLKKGLVYVLGLLRPCMRNCKAIVAKSQSKADITLSCLINTVIPYTIMVYSVFCVS